MLEKYSSLQTQLPYLPHLVLLSTLMIGMVICFIVSSFTHQHQEPESCKIEYISRDEILAFEKARIARTKDKQLFFGKTREAISLIQNIAKTRGNSNSHVIFTKGSYVKGKGVYSISEDIHSEVVQALKNSAKDGKEDDGSNDGNGGGDEENEDAEASEEDKGGGGNGDDDNNTKGTSGSAMKLLEQLKETAAW